MKTLVLFPAPAVFSQQAALAFAERDALKAFLTTFVYNPDSRLADLVSLMPPPLRRRVHAELSRRSTPFLPSELVETHPFLEILRVASVKLGANPKVVDQIWDIMAKDLTRAARRRLKSGEVGAVYAYEYTALEVFKAAEKTGAIKILDFPSLNSRQFERLLKEEKSKFPELIDEHDEYFASKFEIRQARRDAEMGSADLIITNSSVTRSSHIEGGADPEKTFAVPYGAPPTIEKISERGTEDRLKIVWAGSFSIRKGAHLFVEAWRSLKSRDAQVDIYGAVTLPNRLISPLPTGMTFHGSIVRPKLFQAFEQADVLIFPTLSDGFGMVVTEAFARGLPVITTNSAGASDLVVHGRNGLIIESGEVEPITDALKWCLDNRDKLLEMRPFALETAKNWQWADYRRKLIAVVEEGLVGSDHGISISKNFA